MKISSSNRLAWVVMLAMVSRVVWRAGVRSYGAVGA